MDFSDVRRAMAIAITETEGDSTHWAISDVWHDWQKIDRMKEGDEVHWYCRNGGTGCSDEPFPDDLVKFYKVHFVIRREACGYVIE